MNDHVCLNVSLDIFFCHLPLRGWLFVSNYLYEWEGEHGAPFLENTWQLFIAIVDYYGVVFVVVIGSGKLNNQDFMLKSEHITQDHTVF